MSGAGTVPSDASSELLILSRLIGGAPLADEKRGLVSSRLAYLSGRAVAWERMEAQPDPALALDRPMAFSRNVPVATNAERDAVTAANALLKALDALPPGVQTRLTLTAFNTVASAVLLSVPIADLPGAVAALQAVCNGVLGSRGFKGWRV